MKKKSRTKNKNVSQQTLDEKYSLRKWVFRSILAIIIIGVLGPFVAQCILTCTHPTAVDGLNIWNQYVSIILGMVATILSIVSLIMGFKNYDDTLSLQQYNIDVLHRLETISGTVDEMKCKVFNEGQKNDSSATTVLDVKTRWDEEKEEK